MTGRQWQAFVTHGTRTGMLSTVRADGNPHVTPLWFLLDGDDIVLTTEKNSVKGRNLARDGRFALCVDEDRPPYAFVLLQGRAWISEDPDDMLRWGGLLGTRYMGDDRAEEYAARNGGPATSSSAAASTTSSPSTASPTGPWVESRGSETEPARPRPIDQPTGTA